MGTTIIYGSNSFLSSIFSNIVLVGKTLSNNTTNATLSLPLACALSIMRRFFFSYPFCTAVYIRYFFFLSRSSLIRFFAADNAVRTDFRPSFFGNLPVFSYLMNALKSFVWFLREKLSYLCKVSATTFTSRHFSGVSEEFETYLRKFSHTLLGLYFFTQRL